MNYRNETWLRAYVFFEKFTWTWCTNYKNLWNYGWVLYIYEILIYVLIFFIFESVCVCLVWPFFIKIWTVSFHMVNSFCCYQYRYSTDMLLNRSINKLVNILCNIETFVHAGDNSVTFFPWKLLFIRLLNKNQLCRVSPSYRGFNEYSAISIVGEQTLFKFIQPHMNKFLRYCLENKGYTTKATQLYFLRDLLRYFFLLSSTNY